jgi:hypothetical protein
MPVKRRPSARPKLKESLPATHLTGPADVQDEFSAVQGVTTVQPRWHRVQANVGTGRQLKQLEKVGRAIEGLSPTPR